MSMIKLISSDNLPDSFDSQTSVIEDPAVFTKQASAAGLFDYDTLKPDDDHVGIHLIALGATETYGLNRNGDSFPKEACVKYHDTFVKHGHVYSSHKNSNPEIARGIIKASAWNPTMDRIELFIHANKDKASKELEKIAKDGSHPYSMACKVPGDVCTICNQFRKSAMDTNQCDHVKYNLGKMADDGSIVGTHNNDPRFFDISFVFRPADRIAWDLHNTGVKTASANTIDSITMAAEAGVIEPMAFVEKSALAKYEVAKRLLAMEGEYNKLTEKKASTGWELHLEGIAKAASTTVLSPGTIESLRVFNPHDAFYTLADNNMVMNVEDYVKYAMGMDYGVLRDCMPQIKEACSNIYTNLDKEGSLLDICKESVYNIDTKDPLRLRSVHLDEVIKSASFDTNAIAHRAVSALADVTDISNVVTKQADATVKQVAKKYAAYKVAAITAMHELGKSVEDQQYALAIAQNKVNII